MAQTVFGAEYAVSVLNRAFNNTSPSNAVFNNQVKTAGDTEATQAAFAANFGKSFINTSDAALATQVLTNLGVLPSDVAEVQALEGALADVFGTVSKEDRGIVVLQLGAILSGLETATGDLAVYAPAAKAWNIEVERAYVYSSNSAHTTPQEGDDGAGSTTLTRFTDVLSGSAFTGYLDYNQYTGFDEQTLTTGDRLTGTAGDADTLFAQQVGGSRPTLSGIEIVSIDAKGATPNLDLSDSTGVKQVVNYRSSETSTLTFSGLKNLVDVEVDHTNANTVAIFNGSVVAGVNDSLNLSVKGAGVAAKPSNFTAQGIENLNIAATEDASVLGTVSSTNVKKLTITGDKNLTVGTKVTAAAAGANLAAATAANVDPAAALAQLAGLKAAITARIAALDAAGNNDGTIDAADVSALTAAQVVTGTTVPAANTVVTGALAALNAALNAQAASGAVTNAAAAVAVNAILDGIVNNAAASAAANLAAATAANAAATAVGAAQGFDSANIETVDGSAATGNLFLNLTASAGRDQTVSTGTGNDVVVTGNLNATDTFNLGEGNDRLVLETASTNEAAKLQGVEEVEARVANTNLNLVNAPDVKLLAVAQDAGFANVTAVKSGTTVAFEGRGLANAVSNSAVNFGAVTYNLANANGTSDVIDFTFKNAGVALGANSNVNIGVLNNTGNNTETLNFTFNDVVATSTVTVADIAGNLTALKTLNVTSDSKVVLNGVADLTKLTTVDATGVKGGFTAVFANTLAESAATTIKLGGAGVNNVQAGGVQDISATPATTKQLLTVDGSAGTGNQVITITGNADTSIALVGDVNSGAVATAKGSVSVLGGSGNDTITVTSTALSVNLIQGGAGSDTINLAASAGVDVIRLAAGDATGAARDTVNNFVSGTDKFDLSAFGFDIALHGVTVGGAALNGTATEFGGKAAYVDNVANVLYVDVNGDNKFDAADLVVNVTGVAVVAGDILFV